MIFKDSIVGLRKAFIRTLFDLQAAEGNNDLDKVAQLSKIEERHLSTICNVLKKDPENIVLDDIREKLSKL